MVQITEREFGQMVEKVEQLTRGISEIKTDVREVKETTEETQKEVSELKITVARIEEKQKVMDSTHSKTLWEKVSTPLSVVVTIIGIITFIAIAAQNGVRL